MRTLRHILLIVLALHLQTSWVHKIAISGMMPNLVLIVLVYIGISSGQITATVFGFFSGFIVDIYAAPSSVGINTMANAVVGFAVGYSRIGVVAEDLRVQALTLFLASSLHSLIYFALDAALNPTLAFPFMLRSGLATACYTACVGMAFCLLLSVRFDGGIHLDVRRLYG